MAVLRRFDDWKCAMLVQALLLIAVIVVISGSILTNALVTARAGFAQAVQAQSRTAMSDATADFVTWAQARVQSGTSQTSWRAKIVAGRSDSDEFRPICDPSLVAAGNTTPACSHWEHNTWMVTGGTTVGSQTQPQPQPAYLPVGGGERVQNLARTVDEQRITAIVSTEVKSPDGRQTYASDSREITARTFDAAPWVVVTGIKEIGTIDGGFSTGEGDSGGFGDPQRRASLQQQPDPSTPASFTDTRIITHVTCLNSPNINNADPMKNTAATVLNANRGGNQDWKYEIPCVPVYNTAKAPDPLFIKPTTSIYATIDDNRSFRIINKGRGISSFAN